MNCQDFEDLILDLARKGTGSEAWRASAMEHAGSCPLCRRRLDDQLALTEALRLAAEDNAESPSRLETAVLSAFRERQGKLLQQQQAGSRRRFSWAPAWGIAAALTVAVLGFALFRTLTPARLTGSLSAGKEAGDALQPGTGGSAGPRVERPSVEVSTDFIQLTSGAGIASMESGQLVRVLLPRSAVAAYGLPFNRELADRPVAAQVLVGQDGMARAIRFLGEPDVRNVSTSLGTGK
ncbi:MAG: hypothetical protein H6Q05_907 [Acidobacteria bacterium]|nr:hypothetical protein [Acidobacteriota bacterium]